MIVVPQRSDLSWSIRPASATSDFVAGTMLHAGNPQKGMQDY